MIRCNPELDHTNGFFVACFERINDAKRKIQSKRKGKDKRSRVKHGEEAM